GCTRRAHRQVRGLFAGQRDAALADAGALADPLVRRVHLFGQIVIGDDVGRQARTATYDTRPDHISLALMPALSAAMAERSAVMRALRSALAMSMARSTALAKPTASALPWLFTTMPLRPKNTPPFWARGSILRFSAFSAPEAITAPNLENSERLRAWRSQEPTSRAVPSAVLSAILPVKPSVTTTSTVPLEISSPSTKPWNAMGRLELRRIWAAPLTA